MSRLVRAKQQLIEVLNEQKLATIHRAVTRGLMSDVRMKPTSVVWLARVPEHWDIAPLRRFTTSRCDGPFGSGLKSVHYADKGVRVVRLQNIGYAEFLDREAAYISPEHYATLGDHDVLRGDLLVAGLGEDRIPAGRACVAPDGIQPAMVKADCFRFRLRTDRLVPDFAALHLSATARDASAVLSTGATRQRINLQKTAGRAIAVPPQREQRAIVAYLDDAISTVSGAIIRARREIELIHEYRARLVADVVTGKLDVREVKLPEISNQETPLHELGLSEAEISLETEEVSIADL